MNVALLGVLLLLAIAVFLLVAVTLARSVGRATPDQLLVIRSRGQTRYIKGGTALVWPGLQSSGILNMKTVTVTWQADKPLPTSARVAIDPVEPAVSVAVERLLDASLEDIGDIAGSFLIAELQRHVKERGYQAGSTDADLGKALRKKLGLVLLDLTR